MKEKHQTPAQHVTNPVWLRDQIGKLVQDCGKNIAEDQQLADKARYYSEQDLYLERVESHRHWKRQLERILAGKTFTEELADTLIEQGVQP